MILVTSRVKCNFHHALNTNTVDSPLVAFNSEVLRLCMLVKLARGLLVVEGIRGVTLGSWSGPAAALDVVTFWSADGVT